MTRPPAGVSVVVPVRDGGQDFVRCLASLEACDPPAAEIVVVDDRGTDGSADRARRSGARVLRREVAGGPSAARNLGAREARHELVFFVDADVAVRPDAVGKVAAAFAADPGLAALFGSYDDAPAATNFLSQYKNLLHHYVHQHSREEASTFFGACGAVRREVFLRAGGFDEGYRRPCIEDIEFGYRLTSAGHRIRLVKDLQVTHLKGWGVASLLQADILCRGIPWTRLILRDRRLVNDLNLDTRGRLSALLAVGLAACLFSAPWHPSLLVPAGLAAAALAAVNANLYRFFLRRRGWWFTLRALPWHWFYFLYASFSFAAGAALHLLGRPRRGTAPVPSPGREP